MATYTAPTTRTTGALISASIWNTDIVENLKYFKDAPVFDGDISVGDDIFLTSTGAVINFASGDVTVTHSTNTLTFAGAASGYIFNDGNVGIGVTPGSILHLRGSAPTLTLDDSGNTTTTISYRPQAASYAERGAVSWNVTTGEMRISAGASGGSFFQSFYTNGTEQVRITSGGNVGIKAAARLYLDGVAGTGDTYLSEWTTNQFRFVCGGTTVMDITTNAVVSYGAIGIGFYGNGVGASTGTTVVHNSDGYLYRQSSSRRFKENISPAVITDAQLDAFMATTPSWWDYTGQKNGALGFIAEDLAALPLDRYGVNPLVNYGGDGQIESNRDYALIAMHHLVIQRMQKEIDALKARIH